MITQKEKRREIITMLEELPEYVLDRVLKLLQEEKQEITSVTGKDVIDRLTKKQIVIPPMAQKGQKARHTPIKVGGKPLSKNIIEDRR